MGMRHLTAAALALAAMLPTPVLAADYADILGKWRVTQVRTVESPHGVQALADDDPLYMGAGIDFQLDGIVWLPQPQQQFEADDRKSVVWGKSVSVGVDIGGRRTLKKKK